MTTAHEHFSQQFHAWEIRGRGWKVFEYSVCPEPPFVPFSVRMMTSAADDGRRPTFFSSLAKKLTQKTKPEKAPEEMPEPAPVPLNRDALIEFQASLPDKLDISREAFEQFLQSLYLCREPISFEILGTHRKIIIQFVAAESDARLLRRQLEAFFPEAVFVPAENTLVSAWEKVPDSDSLAVEFGLEREFMLPLATGGGDPFIGIVGAMSELQADECALFQVMFQPISERWNENIVDSVTDSTGKPLFANHPELTKAAENKVSKPLFVAVIRIMVCARDSDSVTQLASDIAGSLRVFAHPKGNALIPLHNAEYPAEDHIADALLRQSRRTGMILNSEELTGFVHIPSSAVRSPAFKRQISKTKAAPSIVRSEDGLFLGQNEHAGSAFPVSLAPEQRVRHAHIIGASGTGKSTLLFNLITQAIAGGEGVAVVDPHGDLIDAILGSIPPERIDDVIFIDPSDPEYSVGFNILSAHSELEKTLLASDLVDTFQRLSTSWGDQMNSVLQNALLAFLESDRRGTIADLRIFLTDSAYRNDFLKSVNDQGVIDYWHTSFPHLSGNKSIGSILTRLDVFLAQKPIRHMVSQTENRLDFAHIMDSGKIFLAKLPEGLLGRENSHLLGTFLISKFQQIAMSRQAQQVEARRLFSIFIDEFANFITPSMAGILSGARKYRIGLVLAHHDLHQLQRSPEVASAVMTHPYTRVVFRVGDDDAKKLAEGFSHFEPNDLRNLDTGKAIVRVERSDFDFNLSVALSPVVDPAGAAARRNEVITASRKKYATARADVEAMLARARGGTANFRNPRANEAVAVSTPPSQRAAEVISTPPPIPYAEPRVPEAPRKAADIPLAARDLGRGGAQHQAIQRRIKEAAESMGFRSVIERQILDGQGSIDLWIERGGQEIACEISVSTTIDHEVRNVSKCLKAGIPKVAVICLEDERLRKIGSAVMGSLGSAQAARVGYFSPDSFIASLGEMQPEAAKETETTQMRRGYRVKRQSAPMSPQEKKEWDEKVIQAMAESMRRKK